MEKDYDKNLLPYPSIGVPAHMYFRSVYESYMYMCNNDIRELELPCTSCSIDTYRLYASKLNGKLWQVIVAIYIAKFLKSSCTQYYNNMETFSWSIYIYII